MHVLGLRSAFPTQSKAVTYSAIDACSQLWSQFLSACEPLLMWSTSWPVDHLRLNLDLNHAVGSLLSWILTVLQSPRMAKITQAFSSSQEVWRGQVLIMLQIPFLSFTLHPGSTTCSDVCVLCRAFEPCLVSTVVSFACELLILETAQTSPAPVASETDASLPFT